MDALGSPVLSSLRALQPRIADADREGVREAIASISAQMCESLPVRGLDEVVDATVAVCRNLYGIGRSGEALPLARAVLVQATRAEERQQMRRAATLCGLLAGDTVDLVGATEYHIQALRLSASEDDRTEMSKAWGNIGLAIALTGNYEMAAGCHRRSLALVDGGEPTYTRYATCSNLAHCCFHMGDLEGGTRHAQRALLEMTPAFHDHDPHGAILLRRNLVWLLLAAGRTRDAEPHVRAAAITAEQVRSPRASIAADLTRASYELATGATDLALTRLERILTVARQVPAILHDALACAIQAEEAAGNAARALLRLEELSEHVYRAGVGRTREYIELQGLEVAGDATACHRQQSRRRLAAQLSPPEQPPGWKTLQRLSVAAVLRMDPTGLHGVRVGALSKALAIAAGCAPLRGLEIGLAAELHDIGMTSVPAGILSKKGRLNPAEHGLVLRHADAGAEILRDDRHPMMLLAREVAQYHHARWDGAGHPDRVGGLFIPFAARVCAIADAYDAMACGLGGRAPLALNAALEELLAQAGRQFDPQLVACFCSMVRSELLDTGIDPDSGAGMEGFLELIASLNEDRGFV